MKYDHMVKANGKYYAAGNEVPDMVVETLPFSDSEPEHRSYTKTEINRMSASELHELALKEGVAGADEMTGGELKKYFIDAFGL